MKKEHRQDYIDIALKGAPQWFLNIALLGVFAMLSMPLVWLWVSWSLAWRISVTGFLVLMIFGWIYLFIKKEAEKYIDTEIKKTEGNPSHKSKFQQRMDDMMAKAETEKQTRNAQM